MAAYPATNKNALPPYGTAFLFAPSTDIPVKVPMSLTSILPRLVPSAHVKAVLQTADCNHGAVLLGALPLAVLSALFVNSRKIFQHDLTPHRIGERLCISAFLSSSDSRWWVSDRFMPPSLVLNFKSDAGLRPCLGHTSAVGTPVSYPLIIPIICAFVIRLFRICLRFQRLGKLCIKLGKVSGGRARQS